MSSAVETLATFLHFDDPARARSRSKSLQDARAATQTQALSAPLRGPATDAVIATARTLLRSPLGDVMGAAWGKLDALLKFRDTSAYPPDQINDFTLHEHEIALSRHPSVALVVNGVPTGAEFQFELKIGLTIESALLKIRNGRIIGAEVGKLHGGGAFRCGEVVLAERKTDSFRLPGALSFTPDIPIG